MPVGLSQRTNMVPRNGASVYYEPRRCFRHCPDFDQVPLTRRQMCHKLLVTHMELKMMQGTARLNGLEAAVTLNPCTVHLPAGWHSRRGWFMGCCHGGRGRIGLHSRAYARELQRGVQWRAC